jgi:hypothetical protein
LVIEIQKTELEAVQVHPAGVVTDTVPVPAADVAEAVVGVTPAVQVAPACVTVNVRPAIVSVPVRLDVDVFAATLKVTAALPLVLGPAPDVIVIQETLLDADQEQSAGIVTETTRLPPVAGSESLVDESDAVQGAPACVTVSSRPPIAIVPVRVDPDAFASTRYVTAPEPDPEAPVSTVIQDTVETAVQLQPDGMATSTAPLFVPAAGTLWVVGVSVPSHGAPACVITNDWPATVSVVDRELLVLLAATE